MQIIQGNLPTRNEEVPKRKILPAITDIPGLLIEDTLRAGAKKVGEVLLNKMTTKIVMSNSFGLWGSFNFVIHEMCPEKYEANMSPWHTEFKVLSDKTSYWVNLGEGNFMHVNGKIVRAMGYFSMYLEATFYGPKRMYYRHKVVKRTMSYHSKNRIRLINGMSYQSGEYMVSTHSFDHIVMSASSKQRIIKGLLNWHRDKQWYEDHYLIHKIGILLYGLPGTGKSSIVKAIASMFNADIFLVDAMALSANGITEIMGSITERDGIKILLFEDIDLLLNKKRTITRKNNLDPSDVDLLADNDSSSCEMNLFFQILDGVYSSRDTIYIATTNCIDQLDEALIRPGRFDIQVELGYFNEDKALEYIELMGYDKGVLDGIMVGEEYPIQPAKLQAMIMAYRASNMR